MDLAGLREVVAGAVSEPCRCHEMARKIAEKLNLLGLKAVVRDGVVTYNGAVLVNHCADILLRALQDTLDDALTEEEREKIIEEFGTSGDIRVFHSWCECEVGGEEIIIDYHACLDIAPQATQFAFLLIHDKKTSPHRYNPIGLSLGKWIFFRTWPPYVVQLKQ